MKYLSIDYSHKKIHYIKAKLFFFCRNTFVQMMGRKQWQQGVRVARWRLCRLALLPYIPCDPALIATQAVGIRVRNTFPPPPNWINSIPLPRAGRRLVCWAWCPVTVHKPLVYCFSHLKLLAHRRLSKYQVDEQSKFTFILKKTLPWPVCPLLIVLYLF